jgi:ligand-binding sensor domain-containing protein
MKSFYLFVITCLLFLKLDAQTAAWTNYNISNSGLPENSVRAITFENDSTAWIATDFGLAKFQSGVWTVFNSINSGITSNNIRCVAIDKNKSKWIGTLTGGMFQFNDTVWTSYNTTNSPLPDDFVRHIAIDTLGSLWIGTIGGLAKKDTASNWNTYLMFTSPLASNNVAYIYVNPINNDKICGTINGGITYVEKDTNLTSYTIQNSGISDNTVLGILKDQSNNVCMASPANGLIYKLATFGWYTYNIVSSTIQSPSLSSLDIDSNGDIWIGSNDEGLIHKVGNTFTNYATYNSPITDDYVQCVRVSPTGKIWLGTQTGGLFIVDPLLLTGVNQIKSTTNVSVYPNPFIGNQISIESEIEISKIRVITLDGAVISESIYNERKVKQELPVLNAGFYLVQIYFKNGRMATQKLVRE